MIQEVPTEVTRYLSAAAYRDRFFRNDVIHSTLENRHRALAPCAGVDLSTVCGIAYARVVATYIGTSR